MADPCPEQVGAERNAGLGNEEMAEPTWRKMGYRCGLSQGNRRIQVIADPVEYPCDSLVRHGCSGSLSSEQINDLFGGFDQGGIIVRSAIVEGSQEVARAAEHGGVIDRCQIGIAVTDGQSPPAEGLGLDKDHDDVLATSIKLVLAVVHDDGGMH